MTQNWSLRPGECQGVSTCAEPEVTSTIGLTVWVQTKLSERVRTDPVYVGGAVLPSQE